ncbi:hypothetical protein [Desulfovibrio sp. ZJ200]|uniref:hypothetical protein n=1 Tax=Desulfovibrio sp. ZJ200 TaxID=2709792 RepID=UPI0013EA96C4|nr:hypothetical protein [Desulfovibrio sp. ZJ200]
MRQKPRRGALQPPPCGMEAARNRTFRTMVATRRFPELCDSQRHKRAWNNGSVNARIMAEFAALGKAALHVRI